MNFYCRIQVCLFFFWVFLGCAVVPEKYESQLKKYPQPDCKSKVSAKFSFREVSRSALVFEREYENTHEAWVSFVAEKLENSNSFDLKSDKPKYSIELTMQQDFYSNKLQQILYWVSGATAGILPTFGFGSLRLQAIVRGPGGSEISAVVSGEQEFYYFQGLVFFPMTFFSQFSNSDLQKTVLPILTNEVIEKLTRGSSSLCE